VVTLAFHSDRKFYENLFVEVEKNEEAEIPVSDQTCMHIFPEGQYRQYILFLHI